MKYRITFGRCVVAHIIVEAGSEDEASRKGIEMDLAGEMRVAATFENPEVELSHVTDDESIWEIEEWSDDDSPLPVMQLAAAERGEEESE